jgi:hypothetical protein
MMVEKRRADLLKDIEPIFRYFNKHEDLTRAVVGQRKSFYNLPYNNDVRRRFTMKGLFEHMKRLPIYDRIVSDVYDNQYPILECALTCRPADGVYFETGTSLKASVRVKSISDYYDIRNSVTASESKKLREQILANYPEYRDEFIADYCDTYNTAIGIINILDVQSETYFNTEVIASMSNQDFYSDNTLESLRSNLTELARLRTYISLIESMNRVGNYAFIDLGDTQSNQVINNTETQPEEIYALYDTIHKRYEKAVALIHKRLRTPEGHSMVVDKPGLNWYFTNPKLYL